MLTKFGNSFIGNNSLVSPVYDNSLFFTSNDLYSLAVLEEDSDYSFNEKESSTESTLPGNSDLKVM